MDEYDFFYKGLRQALDNKIISQSELARRVGCTKHHIHNIYHQFEGRRAGPKLQKKITHELNNLGIFINRGNNQQTNGCLANGNILVVDDSESMLECYRKILTAPSRNKNSQELELLLREERAEVLPRFNVFACNQGEQAVRLVEESANAGNPILVAFIDVRMPPGVDGIETAEQIRQIDNDMELVIVSAYSEYSMREINNRLRPAEKVLYLNKPFLPDVVLQMAINLTNRRRKELWHDEDK